MKQIISFQFGSSFKRSHLVQMSCGAELLASDIARSFLTKLQLKDGRETQCGRELAVVLAISCKVSWQTFTPTALATKLYDAIKHGTLPKDVQADPSIWWHAGQGLVLNKQQIIDEAGAIPVLADDVQVIAGDTAGEAAGSEDPPAAGSEDPPAKKRKAKKTLDFAVKMWFLDYEELQQARFGWSWSKSLQDAKAKAPEHFGD
eukprot:5863231-Amphidinium_carterae.2